MCENCYDNEIESFPTEEDWLKFDLELTKKLGNQKMMHTKFNPDGKRDKDDGEYIYVCNYCQQKWKLKDPDYSFRGYFLKAKEKQNKNRQHTMRKTCFGIVCA